MSTNTEPKWYRDLMARDAETGRLDRISIRHSNTESNNIVLNAGSEEMIKVTKDGFYVRGVRVEQDEHEAQKVYECFREWLTWSTLNRT